MRECLHSCQASTISTVLLTLPCLARKNLTQSWSLSERLISGPRLWRSCSMTSAWSLSSPSKMLPAEDEEEVMVMEEGELSTRDEQSLLSVSFQLSQHSPHLRLVVPLTPLSSPLLSSSLLFSQEKTRDQINETRRRRSHGGENSWGSIKKCLILKVKSIYTHNHCC